jgi:hypothetical protein
MSIHTSGNALSSPLARPWAAEGPGVRVGAKRAQEPEHLGTDNNVNRTARGTPTLTPNPSPALGRARGVMVSP